MTIDEAIKHCEEVAEEQENKASFNEYRFKTKHIEVYERQWKNCKECASEHRQLAEWLRELRALKENDDVKDVFKNCDTCKYQSLEVDEFPCDRCLHRYINQYVYDDKREVNADEVSNNDR